MSIEAGRHVSEAFRKSELVIGCDSFSFICVFGKEQKRITVISGKHNTC